MLNARVLYESHSLCSDVPSTGFNILLWELYSRPALLKRRSSGSEIAFWILKRARSRSPLHRMRTQLLGLDPRFWQRLWTRGTGRFCRRSIKRLSANSLIFGRSATPSWPCSCRTPGPGVWSRRCVARQRCRGFQGSGGGQICCGRPRAQNTRSEERPSVR